MAQSAIKPLRGGRSIQVILWITSQHPRIIPHYLLESWAWARLRDACCRCKNEGCCASLEAAMDTKGSSAGRCLAFRSLQDSNNKKAFLPSLCNSILGLCQKSSSPTTPNDCIRPSHLGEYTSHKSPHSKFRWRCMRTGLGVYICSLKTRPNRSFLKTQRLGQRRNDDLTNLKSIEPPKDLALKSHLKLIRQW